MSYADQVKNPEKKDASVTIRTSDNGGFIVECSWTEKNPTKDSESDDCCSPGNSYKHKTYVYETLEAAQAAVPGLISLKQDMDEKDPIDRKIMKEED